MRRLPPFCSVLRLTLSLSGILLIISPFTSSGVNIVRGPFFFPAGNAPLAGTLQVDTDVPSRVSVSYDDGLHVWQRNFYDYGTTHVIPLLGFYANRTNQISVTVSDKAGNSASTTPPMIFVTGPLPSDFPVSVLLTNQPDKMEPGYTLFRVQNRTDNVAYLVIVDNAGQVVWYSGVPSTSDVRQLANGDLFLPLTSSFEELDLLGNTVQTWPVPNNLTINLHDGVPTPHGTILYLNDASEVLTNFPTSDTDPNSPPATSWVLYNRVVEISATNSSLLNIWSPINVLDPRRLTYLTFALNTPYGWDIEHANALIEDPKDNSLIISMREQNAVIKFARDTGAVKWILGPPEQWGPAFQQYLLTPVGTPFQWQYGQHAPIFTPQGTLMVYDDGNYRASPFDPPLADTDNYSRAVEYSINEQTMEISQVWQYGETNSNDRLYTDRVGNAERLPQTGNVLVDFGYVIYINGQRPSSYSPGATMFRIQEVTHDASPEVVFDLEFFDSSNTKSNYNGYFAYRAHRIPDLYSTQPQPVTDLALVMESGTATLEFTGDPNRTYLVEGSSDLSTWTELGSASGDEQGNFSFGDGITSYTAARYFRVRSQ